MQCRGAIGCTLHQPPEHHFAKQRIIAIAVQLPINFSQEQPAFEDVFEHRARIFGIDHCSAGRRREFAKNGSVNDEITDGLRQAFDNLFMEVAGEFVTQSGGPAVRGIALGHVAQPCTCRQHQTGGPALRIRDDALDIRGGQGVPRNLLDQLRGFIRVEAQMSHPYLQQMTERTQSREIDAAFSPRSDNRCHRVARARDKLADKLVRFTRQQLRIVNKQDRAWPATGHEFGQPVAPVTRQAATGNRVAGRQQRLFQRSQKTLQRVDARARRHPENGPPFSRKLFGPAQHRRGFPEPGRAADRDHARRGHRARQTFDRLANDVFMRGARRHNRGGNNAHISQTLPIMLAADCCARPARQHYPTGIFATQA